MYHLGKIPQFRKKSVHADANRIGSLCAEGPSKPSGSFFGGLSKAVMLLFVLILSSCSGGEESPKVTEVIPPPPRPQVFRTGNSAEKMIQTPTIEEAGDVFRYDSEGRRDPFRSIIASSSKARKSMMSLPPLQRLSLSELRLIGIVWGGFGFGAIVQTPDGKGYTLRKGTRVGLNSGVVRRITQEEVMIRETVTDIFGETKTKSIVMKLHPQEEGQE